MNEKHPHINARIAAHRIGCALQIVALDVNTP